MVEGNISKAAKLLGILRGTLRYKLEEHDVGNPWAERDRTENQSQNPEKTKTRMRQSAARCPLKSAMVGFRGHGVPGPFQNGCL
jgi:poly(3-hydroxybutyrate) depolymerase